jgi:GTP cyclohydrolase I
VKANSTDKAQDKSICPISHLKPLSSEKCRKGSLKALLSRTQVAWGAFLRPFYSDSLEEELKNESVSHRGGRELMSVRDIARKAPAVSPCEHKTLWFSGQLASC